MKGTLTDSLQQSRQQLEFGTWVAFKSPVFKTKQNHTKFGSKPNPSLNRYSNPSIKLTYIITPKTNNPKIDKRRNYE